MNAIKVIVIILLLIAIGLGLFGGVINFFDISVPLDYLKTRVAFLGAGFVLACFAGILALFIKE